ncbi:MAG: AraC family transcriptional regulator [Acidimicrobiia bacterium]|nr:AraC family transcriptional regulator [Acidimicrobiia bacterium]
MPADALTHILESVRMEGSVFSRADLTAPWGVESGELADGVFHAVVTGRAWVSLADGDTPVEVQRGDVVMFPFGDNHLIADSPDRPTQNIGLLTSVDDRGMGHLVVDGGGAATSLICGRITFEQGTVHPVLSGLPRLIHVRDVDGTMSDIVDTLIGLIATEVDSPSAGSDTILARLTDALVVYVLRGYIEGLPHGEGSWLAGLRDPHIAEALAMIHGKPAHAWTAETLAEAAGLSRSAFFTRFKDQVGETPAEYLTRWRIHLAARLLRHEGCSVAVTAGRVGYGTEAAFSNAFVRVMGIRPGAYKRSA